MKISSHLIKPDLDLIHVHQVHSNIVVTGEKASPNVQADGILLSIHELGSKSLAIKTADCLPLFLMNSNYVAGIHAGWRGIHQKILFHPLLSEQDFEKIWIGPSIRSCCFEVQSDFLGNFPHSQHFIQKDDKLFFNLLAEAQDQIHSLWPKARVEIAPACTCCDNSWHSHRRNQTTERIWHTLTLKE